MFASFTKPAWVPGVLPYLAWKGIRRRTEYGFRAYN